jgi:hypothetical protein
MVAAITCGWLAYKSMGAVWSVGPLATVGGGVIEAQTWALAALTVMLLIGAIFARSDPR